MLVRLFGEGVAPPLSEICGPEETIGGDSVDPAFCFQWCSLPGKTLSRDLPLCLYMTTYSSCFQSTAHLLFVGTTRQVLTRLETKLTGKVCECVCVCKLSFISYSKKTECRDGKARTAQITCCVFVRHGGPVLACG